LDIQWEQIQRIETGITHALPPKFEEAKKAFLAVHDVLKEKALAEDAIDEVVQRLKANRQS
jgi:hypothetical protein